MGIKCLNTRFPPPTDVCGKQRETKMKSIIDYTNCSDVTYTTWGSWNVPLSHITLNLFHLTLRVKPQVKLN